MKKKFPVSALLVGVFALSSVSSVFAAVDQNTNTTIDIYSFNDFHGALKEGSKDAGMAKLVSFINEQKAQNENTIVVSAGDNYNGTPVSNMLYGAPVSEMFKAMDLVTSAVGNHEFDFGRDKIEIWENEGNFPFVAANIIDKATGELVEWADPYVIEEVDGVNVAFIGLATPETAFKANPLYVDDLDFADPTKTAEKYVPLAKADGADIVVLLTHIGTFQDDAGVVTFEEDGKGLPYVDGVDLIFSGHSHQFVSGEVNGVDVVQGYKQGRSVSKATVTITDGEIDVNTEIINFRELKENISEDSEMLKVLEDANKEVEPIMGVVVGNLAEELSHERNIRNTPLGQWITMVMQEEGNVDIAVTNAGGIRAPFDAGDVTMEEVYTVMPFDNVISTFELTGEQVFELFEYGIGTEIYESIGPMQFYGAYVVFDENAEYGNRVKDITLLDGTEIVKDGTYTIATNDFMGTGGDNYTVFKEAKFISEGVFVRDIMANSLKSTDVTTFEPREFVVGVTEEGIPEFQKPVVDPVPPVTVRPEVKPITPTRPVADPFNLVYTVKAGDSLGSIAYANGVTVEYLTTMNNIENPSMIYEGDEIIVGVKNLQGVQNYTVVEGDTLASIAAKFGNEVSSLVFLNGLDNENLIYVDQVLVTLTNE